MMSPPPIITICDKVLEAALRARVDGLAKPPGSLGRMEDIAVRLGSIQNTLKPGVQRALLLIFAGDHGLTEAGVSAYPSSVTAAMVETFLRGRASANAFARAVDADVRVVDAGVASDIPDREGLLKLNIRRGTRNAAEEAAMTEAEVDMALSRGAHLGAASADEGFEILALGEMGIGNSAAAAMIMHSLTGLPLDKCVGRGAGHDDAGLKHKSATLARAMSRVVQSSGDFAGISEPMRALQEFGGYEIAMMTGAMLGAASARRAILVDGFIGTAAALVAARLNPAVLEYCFFSHCSAEAGHSLMLDVLGVKPLLDLQMRLGEGTGALLAIPLLRAAAHLLTDVATLEDVLNGAN